MHGSVVDRAHLWSSSAISLFRALFFILNDAEKHASHSQVNEKDIKSWITVLASLEYEATMTDQYAGKDISLKHPLQSNHFAGQQIPLELYHFRWTR